MKFKLVKSKPTQPKDSNELNLDELETKFGVAPSVPLGETLHSFVRERKIPRKEWKAGALLGLFFWLYRTQYGNAYPATNQNELLEAWDDIDDLVEAKGGVYAAGCIEALFGEKMAWAEGKRLKMIMKKNREKFLHPLVHSQGRKANEFSEWGPRSEGYAVRKL